MFFVRNINQEKFQIKWANMHKTNIHGFTLIELLISITIAVLLLSTAVPSLSTYVSDAKIVGAAEKIKVDMEWARSQAIRGNKDIIMKFQEDNNSWCYGLDDKDSDCDCTNNTCTVNNTLMTNNNTYYSGTAMESKLDGNSKILTFTSRGFTDIQGELALSYEDKNVVFTVNELGRSRICSDQLTQFSDCPQP